jgi:hypothetical protein
MQVDYTLDNLGNRLVANEQIPLMEDITETPEPVDCTVEVPASDVQALKSAIDAANTSASTHDVICLAENSTYTLTSASQADPTTGLPAITSPITIRGNNATIEGNRSSFRLVRVQNTGTLYVENLTLRRGAVVYNYGGILYNDGMVTLSEASILDGSATTAAGIYNRGTLIIRHSDLSYNTSVYEAGAILNEAGGTLTITDSRFRSNYARNGGAGIYNWGNLDVEHTVFTENRTDVSIHSGGAIVAAGTTEVTDSCFANNQALQGDAISAGTTGPLWVNAAGNWWGAGDGPSGGGPGSGDSIRGQVI